MEKTETHLGSMGISPKKAKAPLIMYIIMAVILVLGVTVSVFALTPTPEEVITNEIEALGESWDSWNDIEAQERLNASEATTRANRANEEKVKVENRAKALRVFLESESL